MKRRFLLIMICAALMCFSGCAAGMPAEAVDGTPWSEDWITLGQTLGVEEPGHGLTLRDNKAARQMYYASWSIGEAQPYHRILRRTVHRILSAAFGPDCSVCHIF